MYSSEIGGIITNPALMVIPIDDHMVNRAHGVFDTIYVHDKKIYNFQALLNRLLNSAKNARIDLPYNEE